VARAQFGLTDGEAALLRRMTPPWRIQERLDAMDYDADGVGCRSPRRVLRERRVQCMDGASSPPPRCGMQGYRPLLLDLEAVQDVDHVVARVPGPQPLGRDPRRSNYSGPALPRAAVSELT